MNVFWFKLWHRIKSAFNERDKMKSIDTDDDAKYRAVIFPANLLNLRRPEPETSYGEVIM